MRAAQPCDRYVVAETDTTRTYAIRDSDGKVIDTIEEPLAEELADVKGYLELEKEPTLEELAAQVARLTRLILEGPR